MNDSKIKLPISVLIPTMNRPNTLKRTLETYMQGNYIPSQVIVVDQSAEAGVREEVENVVREYSDLAEVVYVYQKVPSSTTARNTAYKYAQEEIVIFSDDDIDVYHDTLFMIHQKMADTSISMIAGIDDNMQSRTSILSYVFGMKSYKNRKIGHVTKSMLGRFPISIENKQVDTMWAMGFFFVVRKSLVDKFQLRWDETLTGYAYAEDLDFTYSYYKMSTELNRRCIADSDVHVRHMVSQEYRTPSKRNTYAYCVNRWYLSYKHGMGISSRMAIIWCDFGKLMLKIIKKDAPQYLLHASLYACVHRNEIKKGKLNYDFVS